MRGGRRSTRNIHIIGIYRRRPVIDSPETGSQNGNPDSKASGTVDRTSRELPGLRDNAHWDVGTSFNPKDVLRRLLRAGNLRVGGNPGQSTLLTDLLSGAAVVFHEDIRRRQPLAADPD